MLHSLKGIQMIKLYTFVQFINLFQLLLSIPLNVIKFEITQKGPIEEKYTGQGLWYHLAKKKADNFKELLFSFKKELHHKLSPVFFF